MTQAGTLHSYSSHMEMWHKCPNQNPLAYAVKMGSKCVQEHYIILLYSTLLKQEELCMYSLKWKL